MDWHEEYDVVVVGSGGGGLVAAITAAHHGFRTIIIEKGKVWGGATALSSGAVWVPNNHVSKKAGLQDSKEEALTYIHEVIGEPTPASTIERRIAYVENGPKMVGFLENLGFRWVAASDFPDYYPEKMGGKVGRCVESDIFDARLLGKYQQTRRKNSVELPFPLYAGKIAAIPGVFTNTWDFRKVMAMVLKGVKCKLNGQHAVSIGEGMASQLLKIALDLGVQIKLNTPLEDVLMEEDQVAGVLINKERKAYYIKSKAIILAGGGFERNPTLRKRHHRIGTNWTSSCHYNTGDMHFIAMKHQLDTDLLDDAWWGPTIVNPAGKRRCLVYERSLPHSIIVDQAGKRYFNESEPFTEAGNAMLKREKNGGKRIPSWLIMESRHRNRYVFGSMLPKWTPRDAMDSGFFVKANSLEELAEKCEIDAMELKATVERFNHFVKKGVDEDFHRGNSTYDNYFGDRTYKNPNLGKIIRPPFFACQVYPGDLGTKGGIVTNEYGQALRNGVPVKGLYATGNCSASVMGRVYPGPGAALGATMVFGFISGNHIMKTLL